jgi:hypothetical protein
LNYVRALDDARSQRFALKALGGVAVARGVAVQKFQSDAFTDRKVRRLEHGAHAAASDQSIDAILSRNDGTDELCIGRKRRRGLVSHGRTG